MSEILLKTENKLSRSEIASKLSKIAEGVENGEINLSSGEESVKLNPPAEAEFEVEVEEERDGELSLEVEIEWSPEEENEDIEIG